MLPFIISVTGPTATGKSALALSLAKTLGGEIISGDSMQIYRGMDIGTAKPTAAERASVPHHLIDCADISEAFSVSRFISLARESIDEVQSRGKLPVVAGGTGMYIRLLLDGRFFDDPGSDLKLREELYKKAKDEGAEALHAYLALLDRQSADEIHPNNVKRVVRAIEIALTTGATKSEHVAAAENALPPYNCLHLHLTSQNRALLYARTDSRVDEMMNAGLENEVKALVAAGLESAPTASAAIGYKEFFPYFKNEISLSDAVCEIKRHTRQYVKKQTTYFAGIQDKICIDIENRTGESVLEEALGIISKNQRTTNET